MILHLVSISVILWLSSTTALFGVTEEDSSNETGAYRVSLGLYQPTFSEADNYEDFYGSSGVGTNIMVEHFPWEYAVTLGYSIHIGYYQDAGNAANVSGGDLVKDESTETDFTMLPVQISLNLIATPFPDSKWFTLSAWLGFERTMFNEVRKTGETEATEDGDKLVYSNFGFTNASVVGGSFNILNKGKDAGSSVDVMGLRRIFLSPYIEVVSSSGDSGLKLGGNRLGIAFSFELDAG